MKFGPIYVTDKKGQKIELRSAEVSDAAALIAYLKTTAGETPYLIREPEEVTITTEQERAFIQSMEESENELMLLAFADGKHLGNCSLSKVGRKIRYAHRCEVAIALYREYWGRGIGRIMMETILEEAGKCGYEQAELQVMRKNAGAVSLYEKLGFRIYGILSNNMKYKDGSYDDACWMMKQL